ncbi:MAG: NADPH:quinone oxidoreductase family protein [Pseudomonadota bacterium]
MRAVVADAFGPPNSLTLRETVARAPGPGEVRIAVAAAGVTFVDALITRGGHQGAVSFPYVPGTECAGVVEEVGSEVRHLTKGDRVFAITLAGGGFAEQVTVDANLVALAPEGMPFDVLAVFGGSYLTAYHTLVHRTVTRPGELMLVRGAAGALGMAAVQLGRALGLDVVAMASTPAKCEYAMAAGAFAALDSNASDPRAELKALVGDRRVDIVFDPVGGDGAVGMFRALGWDGRYLVLGFAAGTIPALPFNLPLVKCASLIGVDASQFLKRDPELVRDSFRQISAMLGAGKLAPHILTRLPLQAFADALERAATGEGIGRIVLEMRK